MEHFIALVIGIISSFIVSMFFFYKKIRLLPKSFTLREDAKLSMIRDLRNSKAIYFIGISHEKLSQYLEQLIDEAKMSNKKLYLNELHVCFARNEVGATWEPNNFRKSIVKYVTEITIFLAQEDIKSIFPYLKTVSFYQDVYMSYFGGCHILYADKNPILYVVYYLPGPAKKANTVDSFTSKLTYTRGRKFNLYNRYKSSYDYVFNHAKSLYHYRLGLDPWDESVRQWEEFEIRHRVYEKIMRDFLDFIDVSGDNSVLDLGCGTGRMSLLIAEKLDDGRMLLLDKSPRMISKSIENFRKVNKSVDFIIADATKESNLYGHFSNEKFDKIICHFSFHLFLSQEFSIGNFCHLWKRHLNDNGEMSICIHNSIVNCESEEGHMPWVDPLREAIKEFAVTTQLDYTHNRPMLTIDEIINQFAISGFVLVDRDVKEYERSMNDRLDMWKAPGIFKSALNIDTDRYADYYEFINTLYERLSGEGTKPTTTVFLKFRVL